MPSLLPRIEFLAIAIKKNSQKHISKSVFLTFCQIFRMGSYLVLLQINYFFTKYSFLQKPLLFTKPRDHRGKFSFSKRSVHVSKFLFICIIFKLVTKFLGKLSSKFTNTKLLRLFFYLNTLNETIGLNA